MDDPWGSPWASSEERTTQQHDDEKALPHDGPSPPPKAFFGGAVTTNLPEHSAWDDEQDDFGDWASADAPAAAPSWNAWAESSTRGPQSTPKAPYSGRESPLVRPTSTITTPNLRPVLRARTSAVFKQSSPDPWGSSGSPWDDQPRDVSPIRLGVAPLFEEMAEEEIVQKLEGRPAITVDAPAPVVVVETFAEVSLVGQSTKNEEIAALDEAAAMSLNDVETVDVPNGELKAGLVGNASRPSSIFSADSDCTPNPGQESPITSIDEDQALRRRPVTRTASGKVSELVGMYDGLTRAASEEPAVPEQRDSSRSKSRTRVETEIERSDSPDCRPDIDIDSKDSDAVGMHAGDREEALQNPLSFDEGSTSNDPDKQVKVKDDLEASSASQELDEVVESSSGTVDAFQLIRETHGLISFDVDVSLLDKIDMTGAGPAAKSQGVDDVTDRYPTDNFTTIEQRKLWYRISRFGSMRKQNSGEDDNYRHVRWPTSTVHSDTIKIVRRWMEEDSISGKATLGGTKRTGGVFNWDSTAAPMNLDQIFSKRSSTADSKASSVLSSRHAPTLSTGSTGSTNGVSSHRQASTSSVSSVGAFNSATTMTSMSTFGWSSNVAESPVSIHEKSRPNALAPKKPAQQSQNKFALATGFPAPPQTLNILPAVQNDDDDDWGEMVSSPVQQQQQHHGLSTSSIGTFSDKTVTAESGSGSEPPSRLATDPRGFSANNISTAPPANLQMSGAQRGLNAEPWASADFSLFSSSPSKPGGPSGSALLQISAAATLTSIVPEPIEPARKIREEDEAVRRIVSNLPDLTYMLRTP